MFHYTYVLESEAGGKYYIGFTENLKKRFREHNSNQVKATKGGSPFKLVYYEACLNKEKAIEREKTLKTGYGRRYLKYRI